MSSVVLIIPEAKTEADPIVYPPLGLLYIAAALEKDGHDVVIYDMRDPQNTIDKAPYAAFYGFTATTPQINSVIDNSKYLKESTGSFVFIGGAHATRFQDEDKMSVFDAVVCGEGENAARAIIAKKLKGVISAGVSHIDDIEFPARHLLPAHKIRNSSLWEGYGYGEGNLATTVITSRGCAWKCSFCANMPQKTRFRSAGNVVAEIDTILNSYGCYNFRFIDDNFIANKKRLIEIAPMLEEKKISFRCAGRSDLITDETCELLAQSGCKEIGFGIESADNKILKLLEKNETVEKHERAIAIAKKHGLKTKGFFMAGLPGETWETIDKNKEFIEKTNLDKAIVTLFTPYPGCEMWENPQKFGIKIIESDWDRYFQTYPSRSAISSDVASSDELTEHFNEMVGFIRRKQ